MTIEEKIKYIEGKGGLVFDDSSWSSDDCIGTVAYLLKNKLIDNKTSIKLLIIAEKNNFWLNYVNNERLNSESVLFINLVYKIIKNNLTI